MLQLAARQRCGQRGPRDRFAEILEPIVDQSPRISRLVRLPAALEIPGVTSVAEMQAGSHRRGRLRARSGSGGRIHSSLTFCRTSEPAGNWSQGSSTLRTIWHRCNSLLRTFRPGFDGPTVGFYYSIFITRTRV